jgi:hypothetical protein
MDGVLSEVPEGSEEVLPAATSDAEQVSKETTDEKSVDNISNGENSEDAPAEVENALEPLIKTECEAPITLNGMDSNTSCSNSSGTFAFFQLDLWLPLWIIYFRNCRRETRGKNGA